MNIIYADLFPKELKNDTLYVSRQYGTTAHLCVSGCNFRVVLPLGKGGWELVDEQKVSLYPSVHVPSCNSHYWIENGGIRWAKQMSEQMAKDYSRADLELYSEEMQRPSFFGELLAKLKKLFFWMR